MVFSSIPFLFSFFTAVLALYFLTPRKGRNFVLFATSLVFYAWGEPLYVLLMLFSTAFGYLTGLLLERFDQNERARKRVVALSVVGSLAVLMFFKYTDLFLSTINQFGAGIPLLKLALPIGISFYTFQSMSYTIDVYRRAAPVQKNVISFGTYIALFPQLIAGPIVRYGTIADELDNRRESVELFASGLTRFICGLSKKVLLANNIGALWATIKGLPDGEMSVLLAWLGIISFAFQIYFDFSGYSDMAIGLGRMFGFHFTENFNFPYISKSITEFWRRWHISLSTWFKEYVYIPLGGNRVKVGRAYCNLFIVWFLTGMWHGASWNFVLWGLYYGVLLVIEKAALLKILKKIPAVFSHLYVCLTVLVGWVLFEFSTMGEAGRYLSLLFGGAPLCNDRGFYYLLSYLPVLIVLFIGATPLCKNLKDRFFSKKLAWVCPVLCLLGFVICMAYLVDSTYNPFLYFRF